MRDAYGAAVRRTTLPTLYTDPAAYFAHNAVREAMKVTRDEEAEAVYDGNNSKALNIYMASGLFLGVFLGFFYSRKREHPLDTFNRRLLMIAGGGTAGFLVGISMGSYLNQHDYQPQPPINLSICSGNFPEHLPPLTPIDNR